MHLAEKGLTDYPPIKVPDRITGKSTTLKQSAVYQEDLPEAGSNVTVIPKSYEVGQAGSAMTAKIVGPMVEFESLVRIIGNFSGKINLPKLPSSSSSSEVSTSGLPKESEEVFFGNQAEPVDWNSALIQEVSWISLHYVISFTRGLQGNIAYEWDFNGNVIGTSTRVDVTVPISVINFEYGRPNLIGVLSVTATDSFGRTATDFVRLTIGKAVDLRTFVPLGEIAKVPGLVDSPLDDPLNDPLRQLKRDRLGEQVSHVGWVQEETGVAVSEGKLLDYKAFSVTSLGENFVVVATRPEITTSQFQQ